jgi:hypothetical protein
MGIIQKPAEDHELPPPSQVEIPPAGNLIQKLNLPEEVSTQEAAGILNCCKHTVLQYLADDLLEWRNTAPPSSKRPVYRFTLRSVLELRLGYQRGNPHPPQALEANKRRRKTVNPSTFKPKHVRRKGPKSDDDKTTTH